MAHSIDTHLDGHPGTTHRALRLLYGIWMWLVFIPFLVGSTLFFGALAVAFSLVSPRLGHHAGTAWAWCLCRANFTRVRVTGLKNARPGQSFIIMSNHQSNFDVLAFYGHFRKQFRWIIKQELRNVPGLGAGCAAVGHVFLDRSNRQRAVESLNAAREKLLPGVSIMIFPEGRRSSDGRLGVLKKGGFMMALQTGLPILPVSISGAYKVLPGNTLRLFPGTIDITVHEPIDPADYGEGHREELMADVRAALESGLSEDERA